MYILKNALKSVTRIKGRSILIGVVVLIIATSSCVALSIKNSASSLVESYKNENEIEAQITLDRSKMRKDMNSTTSSTAEKGKPQDFMANISEINMDMVKQYANSEYVKGYTYSIQTDVNVSNLEKVSMESVDSNTNSTQMMQKGPQMENSSKNTGDFEIVGYGDLNSMTEFIDSNYTVSDGSVFDVTSTENLCLISDELAENNNLKVGDTITITNPNDESINAEFKITGLYSDNSESTEFSMFSNSANKILTTYTALNNFVNLSTTEDNKMVTQTNATFILQNEEAIDLFLAEIQSKGLSEYYTLTTNLDAINESIQPLKNLNNFATIFLVVVLIIGGAILVIVNMINVRERKYEIGVLRAIGMKKTAVLSQFITETFIVTFVSIIIGILIGSLISVPVANTLLASEIESKQESTSQVSRNFGMEQGRTPGMMQTPAASKDIRNTFAGDESKYIDKINAIINIKTVGELMLIGLGLTLISSSISMFFVARYSPLKILSNRT